MTSSFLDLPASVPLAGVIYGVAAIVTAFVLVAKLSQPSKLGYIPTVVGSNGWLSSWWPGLAYLTNAQDIIQEGYEKHKSSPFKVAELYRWVVVISTRGHLEELRRAADDTLSLTEATNDLLQVKYTMGPQIHHNPYHLPILRSRLRNMGTLCPEIKNEITMAFDDVLDLRGNEWKSVPALSSMKKVVCRMTSRLSVGLPLCRDTDWIDLNIQHVLDVAKGVAIIGLFPDILKPIAAWLFTSVNQTNQCARKLLSPIIAGRRQYINKYEDEWADKLNDSLSWLMEEAEGPELTVKSLTARILAINFVAIHTSSHSFTHALLYLAANPPYIQPLRKEVEAIVKDEGWSKAALGKMQKVDSFLKECQRLEGISSVSLTRKALKDFTFSDGTFIPKGTMVVAAARSIHHDEVFYKNAHAFEPFRFAELREEDGKSMKHQFVSTTTEYLPFGHGRRACPGRFFAANELKSMLAHIVVMYDVKLADNTTRPQTLHFATVTLPDASAKVMFRRRID